MSVLIEREHIGIFGKMNAGKSSVMNLLTQQETSLVDAVPGTTADTRTALQEIHGLGPVKLFDTAGLNEPGELGAKKRRKAYNDLKECDLALLVIDPSAGDLAVERQVIAESRELDKPLLLIYNIFKEQDRAKIETLAGELELLRFYPRLAIRANDLACRAELLDFILANYQSKNDRLELLPFLQKDEYYVLVIPMDVETPPGRYLRPQAMVEEYITRHWAYPVSFRLDLAAARSLGGVETAAEQKRFADFLQNFQKRPQAIITDSQAMDILSQWCPADIALTTFSIVMINYFSRGRLRKFADGAQALKNLRSGDKVLIVEACNHSRIGEDIGTVQIPGHFAQKYPGVLLEHNFGREFQDNQALAQYKLIIHCGGCMLTAQKLQARLRDLESTGVPITNYGLFLACMQGEAALRRVLAPWNI
ncbi:MAG: 50S ribosome-binding GTPase [Candidatus Margulisbacteria bacterium]|jgi:[FeFe] hydrogenase H-cluster maturation GTPase HydF|nr:50S ribosome-binding GTPase [Candidatus Margulisiibacteriota bacterium]